MIKFWHRWLPAAAALVLGQFVALPAPAQDYPSRQVTIVVPFAAGGGTDILARMLAQQLEQRLGKSFVIDNKPGAGTVIGANLVAKAPPDGYTLLMATSTPMAINVTLHKALPYDPATELLPLALVAQVPFVLVVNPALPIYSVPDLIRVAREKPGQLSFGSGGPGAAHHLYAELLKSMTGIEMTHVPYRGSLPALTDVVAGHISLMFVDFAPAAEMLQAGKVRALGVSTKSRVTHYEDIPPINEAGVPGFEAAAWQMLVAPAGTPRAVVARLHGELDAILAQRDVKEQIVKLGLLSMENPSIEGLRDFVKSEIVRWGAIVRQAGVAGSE